MNLLESAKNVIEENRLKKGLEAGEYFYKGWKIQKTEDTGNWNIYAPDGEGIDTAYTLKKAKQIIDWNI